MACKILKILLLLFVCSACKSEKKPDDQTNEKQNILTQTEKDEGWALLFDGKTLDGWHLYNHPDSSSVWRVKDATIFSNSINGMEKHGDLITDEVYENYEFTFEWKLAKGGNSGVFINVQEISKNAVTWQSGPEYQLLDSSHVDYPVISKRSGCLYGYAPQLNATIPKPVGQWNKSTIKQKNGKVTFYLNDNLTAEQDFNSEKWKNWIATSGFKDFEGFGISTKGHIALQDWASDVWFRNIKIREN